MLGSITESFIYCLFFSYIICVATLFFLGEHTNHVIKTTRFQEQDITEVSNFYYHKLRLSFPTRQEI